MPRKRQTRIMLNFGSLCFLIYRLKSKNALMASVGEMAIHYSFNPLFWIYAVYIQ